MIKKLAVTAAICAACGAIPGAAAAQVNSVGGEACAAVVKWTFDRPLPSSSGSGTVKVDYAAQPCANSGVTIGTVGLPTPWGGPFERRARTHTFAWSGTCAHADLEPLNGDWVPYGTLKSVYEVHTLAPNPRAVVEVQSASSDGEPPTCPARLVGVVAWTYPSLQP
jgi:hypothetical protein